jgi:uncharacterized protein involved in response to NO
MPPAAGTPWAAAARPRWQWRWLLAAPHRLCFFAGAASMALVAVWWAAMLLARSNGMAWPWAVPASEAHALLMGYAFLPLFFAGFLYTAGPKWLGVAPVTARALLPAVAGYVAGWAVFAAGAHADARAAAAGAAMAAAALAALTWRFIALLRASRVADRLHATLVAAGCTFGVAMLAVATAGLAVRHDTLVLAAVHAGLWGFIALVYVTVVHRMVPFFTASALPLLDAWRPTWLLWTFVAAVSFEAAIAAAEMLWWPLPAGVRLAQAAVEAPLAALLLWLAVRWGLVQSLRIRLLAMLHTGFVWLGTAFALQAASHAMKAWSGHAASLGLAPVHALAMGFFGSTLFAMATRVSAGHGGRPVAADDTVWRLFWVLQAAIALRMVAELWNAGAVALTVAAAVGWAGCMSAWALRYGHWFGTPRADGRPG